MTLMTGGNVAPRDAGKILARVAELGLLDGDEVGPGEMSARVARTAPQGPSKGTPRATLKLRKIMYGKAISR